MPRRTGTETAQSCTGPRLNVTLESSDASANAIRAINTSIAASASPPRIDVIDIRTSRRRCAANQWSDERAE